MISLLKSLFATLQDGTQRTSSRLGALFAMSALLAVPVIVLSAVVWLVKFLTAAPSDTRSILTLICFAVVYGVVAVVRKAQLANERQANAQKLMEDAIYRQVAIMVIPAVSQVVSMDLEPEDIVYDLGVTPFGSGFYYSTPRLLSEDEVRHLRRLLVMKLHGRIQVSRTDIGREGIVIVGKDFIFVRNDPRVVQYFSTST